MIDLTHLNTAAFLWLNHACSALPAWLWASLTITGHASMLFALCSPLLMPRLSTQRGAKVVTALLVCSLVGGLAAARLKEVFKILRPPAVLSPESFHLIGYKLELSSFPSGHSLTTFAVATLLIVGLRLRGWRLAAVLLLACAMGLSRIAVGAHWPMDVLAGAVIGVLSAYVSLFVTNLSFWRHTMVLANGYKWLQIALLFAVSLSLCGTDMGYPEAQVWQWLVAAFGVMMSSYAAILHLKQSKRH